VAQAIFNRLHENDPGNAEYTDELAESLLQQAVAHRAMGDRDPAESAYAQSRVLREELLRLCPDNSTYPYQLARTLKELGAYHIFTVNRYDSAVQVLGEACRSPHRRELISSRTAFVPPIPVAAL
jgi:hypothetical protein